VAASFIDQTIVPIAAPQIQRDSDLTNTRMPWAINAYLLSLVALFALDGPLGGHRSHDGHSGAGERSRIGTCFASAVGGSASPGFNDSAGPVTASQVIATAKCLWRLS